MPKRKAQTSELVRETAAKLGDALARQAVDLVGFCEDNGLSKPTANRAIRLLRSAGFEVFSESELVDRDKWMHTGLYSMPRGSARRWHKLTRSPLGEAGHRAIGAALEAAS